MWLDGEDTPGFTVNSVEDNGSAYLSRVICKRKRNAGQAFERTAPYPKRRRFGRLRDEWGGDKDEGATDGDGDLLQVGSSSLVHD